VRSALDRTHAWLGPLLALAALIHSGLAVGITFTPAGPFPGGQGSDFRTRDIAVADFDEDGNLDFAVTNFGPSTQPPYGNVSVLWGGGGLTFSAPMDWRDGIATLLQVADIDGDGHADIVVDQQDGIVILWGTGTRSVGPTQVLDAAGGQGIALTDIDGDGDTDVIVNVNPDQVEIFYNDGGRTFHSAHFTAGNGGNYVAVGQLDGQNGLDLVVTRFWDSVVSFLFSDGMGGYSPHVDLPGGVLTAGVVIGEFTGDSYPDVFYARRGCFEDSETSCANDGVTLLAGDGAGGFTDVADMQAGEGPLDVAKGDLDGDGRDDVVVTNFNSDDVSIFLGQPGGGLNALPPIPVDRGPNGLVLHDLDGDG
jgi:hypothetical protein